VFRALRKGVQDAAVKLLTNVDAAQLAVFINVRRRPRLLCVPCSAPAQIGPAAQAARGALPRCRSLRPRRMCASTLPSMQQAPTACALELAHRRRASLASHRRPR